MAISSISLQLIVIKFSVIFVVFFADKVCFYSEGYSEALLIYCIRYRIVDTVSHGPECCVDAFSINRISFPAQIKIRSVISSTAQSHF